MMKNNRNSFWHVFLAKRKQYGLSWLVKKLKAGVQHYTFFLLLPLITPFFFILIALNFFFQVQFAASDNGRIGGILPLYWYLVSNERKTRKHNLFILFNSALGKAANPYWDLMFKSKINYLDLPICYTYLKRLINFYRGLGSQLVYTLPNNIFHKSEFVKPVLELKAPYVHLTENECKKGEKLLFDQGIKPEDKIVCFHNRDSAYLNLLNPHSDWSYHDYRDSSIHNYVNAAHYFANQGYRSIRVGNVVLEGLEASDKKFIDYATSSWSSDFLDIYLAHRCTLFVCSDTGISVVPEIFHKPMVYVNWSLLPRLTNWVHFAVFIPKKYYSKKLRRLLSFKELIYHPDFLSPNQNTKWEEYEIIENTPDEILEACKEMDLRIKNQWLDTSDSLTLQDRFWAIYPPEYVRSKKVYLGSQFLKNNSILLDDKNQ